MKKIIKKLGITWITVWLIVAALAFSAFIGYATYTGITSLKRVASTRPGSGFLFTSNYMKSGSTPQMTIEYRDYRDFTDNQGNPLAIDPTYNVTVCNHSQGDNATWYTTSDIDYSIEAKLYLNEKYTSDDNVDSSLVGTYKIPSADDIGDLKFGIKNSSDSNYILFSSSQLTITLPTTSTYTLSRAEASTHTFNLLFDKTELQSNSPRFWIMITATPVSVSGGEVEVISGYIGTCQSAEGGASWTGYIDDESISSIDYDSYNYVISGIGKGEFYFAWNDDMVKPNEFAFLNYSSDIETQASSVSSWNHYTQYGNDPQTGNWKYIKLSVDSDDTARYEFQLYKTSGTNYGSDITKYVDYYFVADED